MEVLYGLFGIFRKEYKNSKAKAKAFRMEEPFTILLQHLLTIQQKLARKQISQHYSILSSKNKA